MINVTKKIEICSGKIENNVAKGENAGFQHFLLFLKCFQKASLPGLLKVGLVWQIIHSFLVELMLNTNPMIFEDLIRVSYICKQTVC